MFFLFVFFGQKNFFLINGMSIFNVETNIKISKITLGLIAWLVLMFHPITKDTLVVHSACVQLCF